MQPRFTLTEIQQALEGAGVAFTVIGARDVGRAIVIAAGARVLALSGPGDDHNVLWLNPRQPELRRAGDVAQLGAGGIGGLRVWQSPEAAYMWEGVPDLAKFSNYRVQPAMDPGNYAIRDVSANRCVLDATISLQDYRDRSSIRFTVQRIIELGPLPRSVADRRQGCTLRLQHRLQLLDGGAAAAVDLWHLMQLPAGTTVGARVRPGAQHVPYFYPERIGALANTNGFLQWRTDGRRMAKFALRTGDLLAGPYAHREDADRLRCFFWHIPRSRIAGYVDAPPQQAANDQLVQFWDGFDFCEVEYHTPGVSRDRPELFDASELIYVEQRGGDPLELLQRMADA
jgi:hypothetical protein